MARILRVDPALMSDSRFLALYASRFDQPVYMKTPTWPFRQSKDYVAVITRRRFNRMDKTHLYEAVIERSGKQCVQCGRKRNLFLDHALPIQWGGTNDIFNLQLLCKTCNSSKGGNLPILEAANA